MHNYKSVDQDEMQLKPNKEFLLSCNFFRSRNRFFMIMCNLW